MKVGDLVELKEHGPAGPGVGVIIEINDYEAWDCGVHASFFRVAWGKDPHASQLAVEDWVYFEQDLKIIRKENG
jgi:hypothetical protein